MTKEDDGISEEDWARAMADAEELISQEEVNALLKGVTGEVDENTSEITDNQFAKLVECQLSWFDTEIEEARLRLVRAEQHLNTLVDARKAFVGLLAMTGEVVQHD
jgi:hypothetical protein